MANPCVGCGTAAIHPFEGLVRSIMDGPLDDVRGTPPLPPLHGQCEAGEWHILHRVMPEHCPRCGRPTGLFSREEP
jgi:hypothetical protein